MPEMLLGLSPLPKGFTNFKVHSNCSWEAKRPFYERELNRDRKSVRHDADHGGQQLVRSNTGSRCWTDLINQGRHPLHVSCAMKGSHEKIECGELGGIAAAFEIIDPTLVSLVGDCAMRIECYVNSELRGYGVSAHLIDLALATFLGHQGTEMPKMVHAPCYALVEPRSPRHRTLQDTNMVSNELSLSIRGRPKILIGLEKSSLFGEHSKEK